MIEVCKGTNLSVFLQRIKQKEDMENKKPIVLNNLEEWDFTDYIDSLIQKEEAVDLEFKIAKDGLPNSLWDTYSSFANTDGGVIVLGVKEHKQQFIIEGLTKEQISQYKKDFWNQINNTECVNENLLSDNDLYEGCYKERNLLSSQERFTHYTRRLERMHFQKHNRIPCSGIFFCQPVTKDSESTRGYNKLYLERYSCRSMGQL